MGRQDEKNRGVGIRDKTATARFCIVDLPTVVTALNTSPQLTAHDARKRLLAYAVQRLGRVETAKRLNISIELLHGWMRGVAEPSTKTILALADLVYEMDKTAGVK